MRVPDGAGMICPVHGPECGRDSRFAILDSLIAAGYGNVPQPAIERLRRRNHGTLPPVPAWAEAIPEGDPGDEPAKPHRQPKQLRPGALKTCVLEAVGPDCGTAHAIAERLGIEIWRASNALGFLRTEGRLEICGQVRARAGQKMFVYRRRVEA